MSNCTALMILLTYMKCYHDKFREHLFHTIQNKKQKNRALLDREKSGFLSQLSYVTHSSVNYINHASHS